MSASTATRRKVAYASLEEIAADAKRLNAADASATGNWSRGQIFEHLARLMDFSLDGFPFNMPGVFRLIGKYYFKPLILKNGMKPGINLKGNSLKALAPDPLEDQAGLDHLLNSIERLQNESQRHRSPFLGELTREEWDLLHQRHAELHMSFIAEPDS